MPPIKCENAENCAKQLAAVFASPEKRQAVFSEFLKANPALKQWEAQAIAERARHLANSPV